jgi:hypothetical protein
MRCCALGNVQTRTASVAPYEAEQQTSTISVKVAVACRYDEVKKGSFAGHSQSCLLLEAVTRAVVVRLETQVGRRL